MTKKNSVLRIRSESSHLWKKLVFALREYTLDEVETMCKRYKEKLKKKEEIRSKINEERKIEREEREIIRKRKEEKNVSIS
jgi:NADH dehydrogenase FAD-containing subunit